MQIRSQSVYQEAAPVKNRTGFFLFAPPCKEKSLEEGGREGGMEGGREEEKINWRGGKINVFTRFICDKVLLGSLI